MKWLKWCFVLVATVLALVGGESKVRYDRYRVYSVNLETQDQLQMLTSLQEAHTYFRFWEYPKSIENYADLMVHPDKFFEFEELLKQHDIKNEVIVCDVQKLIDDEQPSSILRNSANFGWEKYYELNEIYNWLDEIQMKYPKEVTLFTIGKSYEGRNIRGIKISFKPNNPGIFIEANIHAREWLASATATYVINELLTSNNTQIRDIAENINWYIVPVLNVDGFSYSHKVDRLWRKTRQPHPTSKCVGVDPNRNFDTFWSSNGGASLNPCEETYAGPRAFSEPETLALANYVKSLKENISLYLAFHTYGQLILSPYGHTSKEFPANYPDMQSISLESTKALKRRYGTIYRFGSTASTLYTAAGTSADWFYNVQKTPLAFTFEFRDKGQHGFILPANQITPNCEETMEGIVAMIKEAQRLNYLK